MFKKNNAAPKGLNIIIVGCGKVGITLIEQLAQEGHDITIIDKNKESERLPQGAACDSSISK